MSDDHAPYGRDLWGNALPPPAQHRNILADRFVLPPFSILNAAAGPWQERKRGWKALGLKSEVGRDEGLCYNIADWIEKTPDVNESGKTNDTSVFDPVLCELAYRWWCPPDGTILDPFAGGSVRGIVAAMTGRRYLGIDLRPEQVAANLVQADEILGHDPDLRARVHWIAGDSYRVLCDMPLAPTYDMVFTCPPYGDLEVYSEDPRDLSTMTHEGFLVAYSGIIGAAFARLKQDRFGTIVVGDFRDKQGAMRNFPGDTIRAVIDNAPGVRYYNETILQTSTGTLAMRASKQFEVSRKIGKTHQNILGFVRGCPKAAARAIGDVTDGDGI